MTTRKRLRFPTFEEVMEDIHKFESILRNEGIPIAKGSDLELICLHIQDLASKRSGNSALDLSIDPRPMWSRMAGLADLVTLVLYAHRVGRLSTFKPHLQLLNQGMPSQNVRTLSDDACNKAFEMLVGLYFLPKAGSLELEDPNGSKSNNPDVLAELNGDRWGIACKTPNGTSPKTLFERMKDGVGQIERCSRASRGLLYFNFRNVINHEATWPGRLETPVGGDTPRFTFTTWPNETEVEDQLCSLVDTTARNVKQAIGEDNVRNLFVGTKTIPGVMVFLQTTAAIRTEHGELVTTIGLPGMLRYGDVSSSEMKLMQDIQLSRQLV